MKITYILPRYFNTPIGGYKIVYEYANRLTARGHAVTLLVPRTLQPVSAAPLALLKSHVWAAALRRKHRPLIGWFRLDPRVRVRLARDLRPSFVPEADVVVATGWQTAPVVSGLPPGKGRKLYLIQHYEDWDGDADAVRATWTLPLHKTVIARWLWDIARDLGEEARTTYLPSGLDFTAFGLDTPLDARPPHRVALLGHDQAWKGTADAVAALVRVRARVPDVQAVCFGTRPRPADLPPWLEYVREPSPAALRGLYNGSAVFIQASWTEGWGLTATEAMCCGCALVSTDNGGSRDYARDGETALVVPPRRPDLLADALGRLLTDAPLRGRLAAAGHAHVRQYTWDRAIESLEALLRSL